MEFFRSFDAYLQPVDAYGVCFSVEILQTGSVDYDACGIARSRFAVGIYGCDGVALFSSR